MLERELLARIRDTAKLFGWLCYHTHDSRRSEPGFPDLVLLKDRVIFAELKSAKGAVTSEQYRWLNGLAACGVEAYIWRPDDWPQILRLLRGAG